MKEKENPDQNRDKKIPKCIGIIMDGNRRWAEEQGVPVFQGHRKGYEKMRNVGRWAKDIGIEYIIFYCFSIENWKRKEEEVNYLMDLFKFAFTDGVESLFRNEIRIKVVGNISRFSQDIQEMIKKIEDDTKHFKTTMVLAMSYGGRQEILDAVKKISETKTKEEIKKMGEEDFSNFLYTADIPDPDIIIRTSGEMRLSGFLPWQSVYSEFFFLKTYWPAFSKEDFFSVLDEYSLRSRRHGK